ncbi:MAG: serine hydrolase domain-containing protein [Gammaproteobacteria bacterium]|nr:serine hydrolase domain-containing protein [Gammaproteobacteria bacterium]
MATSTLCNVYSTTKGLASTAIAVLHDEGKLDFDEKVTTYWPEFGAAGKGQVTVAQLLSHQAGLCGVDTKLSVADLYDWKKMVGLLEAQSPHWEPGTAAGYHAITWGYFPGELVRRITGKTLGEYFAEKVAEPLGAGHDVYIGLPASELSRVATMNGPNRARKKPKAPAGDIKMPPLYPVALLNPFRQPLSRCQQR